MPRQTLMLTFVLCSFACSTRTEERDAKFARKQQALAMGFNTSDTRFTTPWTSPGTVNICYIPKFGTTLDAGMLSIVSDGIAEAWGASTGLTFASQGTCSSSFSSDWISIMIDPNGVGGFAAQGGTGRRINTTSDGATAWARVDSRTDVQIYLGTNASIGIKLTIAHEMGHALGFYHEMERDEFTSCSGWSTAGSNASGHITAFDSDSIMLWSYCNDTSRTDESLLSSLDKLGGEMLYPYSTSHPIICAKSCFETGDGVITRADGAMTIDWVRRGADIDPVWDVGSSVQNSDGLLNGTDLPSDSLNVTATFSDAFARGHTASGSVIRSDEAYTAILMTMFY